MWLSAKASGSISSTKVWLGDVSYNIMNSLHTVMLFTVANALRSFAGLQVFLPAMFSAITSRSLNGYLVFKFLVCDF